MNRRRFKKRLNACFKLYGCSENAQRCLSPDNFAKALSVILSRVVRRYDAAVKNGEKVTLVNCARQLKDISEVLEFLEEVISKYDARFAEVASIYKSVFKIRSDEIIELKEKYFPTPTLS